MHARSVLLICSLLVLFPCSASGQTQPAARFTGRPFRSALSPRARDILTLLHDRKNTLKDFVGKIDYSTVNKVGDVAGKRGTVDYITDPTRGPIFSADFTMNTENEEAQTRLSHPIHLRWPRLHGQGLPGGTTT